MSLMKMLLLDEARHKGHLAGFLILRILCLIEKGRTNCILVLEIALADHKPRQLLLLEVVKPLSIIFQLLSLI